MSQSHLFEGTLHWTGVAAEADGKLQLPRAFTVSFAGKPSLEGSSPRCSTAMIAGTTRKR
jgi:hypothetical protein